MSDDAKDPPKALPTIVLTIGPDVPRAVAKYYGMEGDASIAQIMAWMEVTLMKAVKELDKRPLSKEQTFPQWVCKPGSA